MICIGLTGGIGSGKSTASEYIKMRGYSVVDADRISKDITRKGNPILDEISGAFGESVIKSDGTLDRKMLAEIAFKDEEGVGKLNAIVTQKVVQILIKERDAIREKKGPGIAFFDVPLLFETGCRDLFDFIWLIDANEDIRIKRVSARDGVTPEEVLARIKNQMLQEDKKRMSDEVIDNSSSLEALYLKIEGLLSKYVEISKG